MTKIEYAKSKGITVEQLQREQMMYLQCEGYDDAGSEYRTLDEWLARKPICDTRDPYDGGRGSGQYGQDDGIWEFITNKD